MQFLVDIRFEDKGTNALVHLVTIFNSSSQQVMELFFSELKSAILRNGAIILFGHFFRIDGDLELKERQFEYYKFCANRATARISVEEYRIDNPDQSKTVYENLTEKLFKGEDSIAKIGPKYNIPVRAIDQQTRNPISGDFYYLNIEVLHQK